MDNFVYDTNAVELSRIAAFLTALLTNLCSPELLSQFSLIVPRLKNLAKSLPFQNVPKV